MDYRVPCIYGKIKNLRVVAEVPGSKSITARALLLAAVADGVSVLENVQFSDDCTVFLGCIKNLGISAERSGNTLTVRGCGGSLPVKKAAVNVGSAGTAARFITALLAFSEGEFYLDSSPQMKKRPIAPLLTALEAAGARFVFHETPYRFPFTVIGTDSPAGRIAVDISKSSQYLSALLIASACADKPVEIVPVGGHGMDYVKMTLAMMRSFGLDVAAGADGYTVSGGYTGTRYAIEPDISAACYFYAMNRILGTEVTVKGADGASLQGDSAFIRLIKDFDGGRADMSACSDQALTLAAVAPYLSSPVEICGIAHVRGQECDRISAIVKNLTALGVRTEERADGVKIYPSQPKGAALETFGDHRVAMSFALTGLRADGVIIKNAEVCSKTFADYFTVFDGVIKKLTGDV